MRTIATSTTTVAKLRALQQLQRVASRRYVVSCNASSEESTESLFMKELKRRGISSTGSVGNQPDPAVRTAPKFDESAGENKADQLSVSRALNSEGLEGLIPRATQLLQLGGGQFLAFLPFMFIFSLFFTAIYLGFGESFVHGGSPVAAPPPYIDPYELLNEPTVDPMIPLR